MCGAEKFNLTSMRNGMPYEEAYIFTPIPKGGSFDSAIELVKLIGIKNEKINIIGYCSHSLKLKLSSRYKTSCLASKSYEENAFYIENNPILKVIYMIPLLIYAFIIYLFKFRKSGILLFNGTFISLILPLIRPILIKRGQKSIVYHHGHPALITSRYVSSLISKTVNRFADHYLVNALHYAYEFRKDGIYAIPMKHTYGFTKEIIQNISAQILCQSNISYPIKIIFPGPRIDVEKRVLPLLIFAIKKCNDPKYYFTFIGDIYLKINMKYVTNKCKNINFISYIHEKETYYNLIKAHHICWSAADVTYPTRPVVECLINGKPVIIPDKPAVLALSGAKVLEKFMPKYTILLPYEESLANDKIIERSIEDAKKYIEYCHYLIEETKKYIEKNIEHNEWILSKLIHEI